MTALTVALATPVLAEPDLALPTCRSAQLHDLAGNPLRPRATRVVATPAVDTTAEVEVGQSMVASFRAAVIPARLRLEQEVRYSGKFMGVGFEIVIPPGSIDVDSRDENGTFYRADDGHLKYATESKPRQKIVVGVFVHDDPEIDPKVFFMGGPMLFRQFQLGETKYQRVDCLAVGATKFRRELVYSGVSNNSVTILYREFSDDMARPAFSQELHYDLGQGREIGYRGARFEVLEATNTKIRYRVIKSLD